MYRKKEKRILILLTLGIFCFITAAWFFLKKLENVFPVTEQERVAALATDVGVFDGTEIAGEPEGTVKLGGKKYEYFHRIESYLFIGTDYSGQEKTETQEYTGDMADFLALLVIDRTDEKYGILQLNRDTMTKIRLIQKNGKGEAMAKQQLCTAHWYGGTAEHSDRNTVEAVKRLLGGIKIDGYYTLNMKHIPEINHAVGGVEVTVEDDFSNSDDSLETGQTVTLTDSQAVHFIHDRMNVGDGENTSRMRRQKSYMEGWYQKAVTKLKEAPGFINDLYREFMESASTDLMGRDVSKIVNRLSVYDSCGIKNIEGKIKLGKALGDGLEHTEFYPNEESLCATMKALYSLEEREE